LTKKDYSAPAIEKAIAILARLAETAPLSINDFHTQLGIPKSSAFVILSTLERYQMIEKTPEGKFVLGPMLFTLGMAYQKHIDIRRIARPHMQELVDNTRYTCHLATLQNNRAVYIDKVEGGGFVRFATYVGQALPLHLSGVGKALLMGMSDDAIEKAVADQLDPLTEKSHRTVQDVLEDIRNAKETGYAIEEEQMEEGIRCIGAPIYGPSGDVIASMSLTSLSGDMPAHKLPALGKRLVETTRAISSELGYTSRPRDAAPN